MCELAHCARFRRTCANSIVPFLPKQASKQFEKRTRTQPNAPPSISAQSFAVIFPLPFMFQVSRHFGSVCLCAMPKRTKEVAPVEVANLNGRTIITGGQMPQSLAWTPPDAMITSVDGHGTFVILHCTDAGLSSLCGVSLRCNKFLDDLLLARNEACDNALEALVATHFTVDTDATSQTKLRALRRGSCRTILHRCPAWSSSTCMDCSSRPRTSLTSGGVSQSQWKGAR